MNNAHTPDLFDLMSRWDVEAKEIPHFLLRMGSRLSSRERDALLVRRATLKRLTEELRDAMAAMAVRYRGIVNGRVLVEANTEDECWAVVHDQGVVEFQMSTTWIPTDRSIAHEK